MDFEWKRFFIIMISTFAVLCGLIGFFNAFTDTYDIWNLPRFKSINYFAVKSEHVERLCKPLQVIDKKPDVIFLGNSKIDFAINPSHYAQIKGTIVPYNFAVRNGEPYELYKFINHALANNQNLKQIFLALDFEMFITKNDTSAGFDENQLGKTHITFDNFFKTLLSSDSVKNNLYSIKMNRIKNYDYQSFESNGKFSDRALEVIFDDEASFWKNSRNGMIIFHDSNTLNIKKFDIIKDIVKLCKDNDINLTVFVPPVHMVHINVYASYRDLYEEWLTKLVEIVPVIDFVACDDMSSIDPELPINENTYFWDSAHMKTIVGDLIIDRLIGQNDTYGYLVTTDNVEQHLNNLWRNLADYNKKFPLISKKCEIIGQFSSDIPNNLLTESTPAEEVNIEHWAVRESHNKYVIRFTGTILQNESDITNAYIILRSSDNKYFYTMASKFWKNDEVDWLQIITKSPENTNYKFFSEAILNDVPEGDYDLLIIYETKDKHLRRSKTNIEKINYRR